LLTAECLIAVTWILLLT